jgi:hypothetical protein
MQVFVRTNDVIQPSVLWNDGIRYLAFYFLGSELLPAPRRFGSLLLAVEECSRSIVERTFFEKLILAASIKLTLLDCKLCKLIICIVY